MEILREEDDERASVAAASPQQRQLPHHHNMATESRKNSSNFGVRTYINAPATAAYRNDDDDGLLLGGERADEHERNLGRPIRHYRAGSTLRSGEDAAQRRLGRWKPWLWVRHFVRNRFAPVVYRILTLIRWQVLLTIGCVTLCAGIVLIGIGIAYHDHQVLFPKDHEIQYLSIADWRLNRRFSALRSIGAVLFGAGGGLALAALGISVLSRCKQHVEEEDNRLTSTSSLTGTNNTAATERRFLIPPSSSYQPIEPSSSSGDSQAAAATGLLLGLTRTTTARRASGSDRLETKSSRQSKSGRRAGSMSAAGQPITPQELPDFPTGSVNVEAVQLSRRADK